MIIKPIARRWLLRFGWLASAILTISMVVFSRVSFIFPVLLGAIGMFSIHFYTKPRRKYYLPIFWTIFYFFGYILALVDVLINIDTAGVGILKDSSLFEFTTGSFLPLFVTILSGMTGILVAVVFCEKVFCKRKAGWHLEVSDLTLDSRAIDPRRTMWLWAILSMGLILLMGKLGIGLTGLPHQTTLPLKLAGIMVYAKNMVVPFVGYLIFLAIVRSRGRQDVICFLILSTIIGVTGSIIFISRAFIVIMIMGPSFYLFSTAEKNDRNWTLLKTYGLVVFGILILLIPTIQMLRNYRYSGYSITLIQGLSGGKLPGLGESVSTVLSLFVVRIVGLRELIGVQNFAPDDIYAPLRVFFGDSDYVTWLTREIHGFVQNPSGDTAFGYAFGQWGMLYLSGSNMVVLIGTSLFAAVVICFEELFSRYGGKSLALFFSMNLGLGTWGGATLFTYSRLVVTAIGCYFLLKLLVIHRPFMSRAHVRLERRSNGMGSR